MFFILTTNLEAEPLQNWHDSSVRTGPRQRPRCKLSFAFTCTLQWVRGLLYWEPSNCSSCSHLKPSALRNVSGSLQSQADTIALAAICHSKSVLHTHEVTRTNTELLKVSLQAHKNQGHWQHISEHSKPHCNSNKINLSKKKPSFLSTHVSKLKYSDSWGGVLSSPAKVCR